MNRSSDDSDDDSRKKKHNGKRYDKTYLPHALLTLPILTALFPALSRRTHLDDWSGFTACRATWICFVPVAGWPFSSSIP